MQYIAASLPRRGKNNVGGSLPLWGPFGFLSLRSQLAKPIDDGSARAAHTCRCIYFLQPAVPSRKLAMPHTQAYQNRTRHCRRD